MRRVVVLLALSGAAALAACSIFGGEDDDNDLPGRVDADAGTEGGTDDGPLGVDDASTDTTPPGLEDDGSTLPPLDAGDVAPDAATCKSTCATGSKCTSAGVCLVNSSPACGSAIQISAPVSYVGRLCKSTAGTATTCGGTRFVHAFHVVSGVNKVTISAIGGSLGLAINKACGGGTCASLPAGGMAANVDIANDQHLVLSAPVSNCADYGIVFDAL